MASTLFLFSALFTAVVLLMTGVGLLGTTLSLRLTLENVSVQGTGLVMSAYFLGLACGGLFCHRLVERVGHIRAFTAFAAAFTAIVMLHGLFFFPILWAALRFLSGISTAGLYTVIESWLNETCESRRRGRVLSVYMLLTYLGMAMGQQFLIFGSVLELNLFFIIGMFLALCMVPVAVTHSISPEVHKPERFHITKLIKKAPIGMLGCFTSGLLTSTFHSIGPVFASELGLSVADISWFMTSAILGGLTLQWPIGKFSDRFDRIKVLSVLALFIAFLSILIMVLSRGPSSLLIIAIGLYGGFIFTIYPISVARAHDLFGPNEILPVTSTLLLVYGIGATAGPIVSSSFMTLTKTPLGFFICSLVISCTFVLIAFSLRKKEKLGIVSVDEQVEFIPIRGTSTVALHIDPRAEEEIYDKFSS